MRLRPPLSSLVVTAMLIAPPASEAQAAFEVVHRFAVAEHAAGAPVQTADGSLYGTTVLGGSATIYRMAPNGAFSVVHVFPGGGSACRSARLMLGSDGMLYGTTWPGCAGPGGTLYRVTPSSGVVTPLFEFRTLADGYGPSALMEAADGFIYGTTDSGGVHGGGTIFRLDRSTGDVSTLYAFGDREATPSPRHPGTALTAARDGLLYGTTESVVDNGGPSDSSTVYRFDPATRAVSIVRLFATADAGHNLARLTLGPDGWLYGTTLIGGAAGMGTAYRVDPVTGTFQLLHAFDPATASEGGYPAAALMLARDGSFYGTASHPSTCPACPETGGAVYRLEVLPSGAAIVTTVTVFDRTTTGAGTAEGLIQTADGFLVGVATGGGPGGGGALYRLDPSSRGGPSNPLQVSILRTFGVTSEGRRPESPPMETGDGALYGATSGGGLQDSGILYRLDETTGAVTTVLSFWPDGEDVQTPSGRLTSAAGNLLYRVVRTLTGAASYESRLLRLDPKTGTHTIVFTFTGANGLGREVSALTAASDGALYGTIADGGSTGTGTIFRFDATSGTVTALAALPRATTGFARQASVLLAARDGFLYGTTYDFTTDGGRITEGGLIFRVDPRSGVVETVYEATPTTLPMGGLVAAANGTLYGLTKPTHLGPQVIYRLDASSHAARTVHTFAGWAQDPLVMGSDGLIYVIAGGEHLTLQRIDPLRGVVTDLHTFAPDEGRPFGLVLASDGFLYGVTPGNVAEGGTIYRVRPVRVPTPLDSDGDGLPNEWEARFGLNVAASTGADGPAGDPDHDGRTTLEEYYAGTHPRGVLTRYLAEGATGSFFTTRFELLNPGSARAIVLFRYCKDDGTTIRQIVDVPAHARATVSPETAVGMQEGAAFSTVIEADAFVVVERIMTWDGTGYGSHAETAAASPSISWYFAEGSTSGAFRLFYLLENPHPFPVNTTVRYLLPSGQAAIEKRYTLAPNSRRTICVDDEGPTLASTDVSTVITASAPIVAERTMYLSNTDDLFAAGHASAGVTAAALEWFLAEGATGWFFDMFILVANPNPVPAAITADYLVLGDGVITKTYAVPANGRLTIWVDDEQVPAGSGRKPLAHASVSTIIRSLNDVPVVVERTMWWPGPGVSANGWYEAHSSAGATQAGTRWAVAGGEADEATGTQTYLLIANASPFAGRAEITLVSASGALERTSVELPALSRTNVPITRQPSGDIGNRFGIIVESRGAPAAEIVVERSTYSSPRGVLWGAGSNVVGTPMP